MIVLDNSALSALAECKTKGVVTYLLNHVPTKAKAEDAPKLAGKAIHGGLAHYLRGGTVEEAMKVIEVMYRSFADKEVPQKDWRMLWPNVERCARSWFDSHPFASLPFDPVVELIEVPFAVPVEFPSISSFEKEVWLTGLIDGIVQDRVDRQYYVLENKTTGQRADWWMRQWRLSSQVSHYTYCAPRARRVREVLGDVTIAGTYINKVDLASLPSDPYKTCKEHGVKFFECGPRHAQHQIQRFDRTKKELVTWLASVEQLVQQWRMFSKSIPTLDYVRAAAVPQEGLFNRACVFCDLNDWCATGRSNMLMLREERWKPIQPEALTA